jgi:twinkle protein
MIHNIEDIKAAANIEEIISPIVKLKRSGTNLVGLCPFHSEKSPSFTVSKVTGKFKCFGCGKSGDSIDFIQETQGINYIEAIKVLANQYSIPIEDDHKVPEKPVPRLEKLPTTTIEYFEKRGISNNTLLRFGITQSTEWMPQAQAEIPVICFNYFRDEELVNIKYRGKNKDFRLNKGSELIFYNLDAIKDETTCVIVEGEVDCLSLHEAGIYPVVSVPNGAGTGTLQLRYLDNCWQYFQNKEKIILLTDNDASGSKLAEELSRRLGRDRCYKVQYPDGCKDANEVLLKHGKQMIHSIVEQARQWPIEGVLDMEDMFDTIKDYYLNGMPKGDSADLGDFDQYLTFAGGQMTVMTGAPGSGKSEFVDYIATQLAKKGWKFGVCSFENEPPYHVTKIMEKYIGLAFDFRKNPLHRMTSTQFDEAMGFVDASFRFVNISQLDVTIQGILSKMRELVLSTGIKGLIIDPWNYIEHKMPPGSTETQYISEALSLIKEFAIKNQVHVFIVAHPKKLQKDPVTKQYPAATLYDIAGSAHFFNKADNGISIHRDFQKGIVTVYIQKVRFSWMGQCGFTSYTYDTFTHQYHQA